MSWERQMCAFHSRKLDRTMTGRRVALTIKAGSELHRDSYIRAHYRFINIISLATKITMFRIIRVLSRSVQIICTIEE